MKKEVVRVGMVGGVRSKDGRWKRVRMKRMGEGNE